MADIKNYTLNFGPQHPAAHGVLRLVLEMNGETIEHADPQIGLLHRATEKLAEQRPYLQNIGYMDRLDYVSMMCNEHAYVMCMEKMLGIDIPIRAKYIRVLFDEITRVLNHMMCLGATALDLGAMSIMLYALKDREDLIDCYEAVSGSRMHATYYRPGGVARDLPHAMPMYEDTGFRSKKSLQKRNQNRQGSLLDFIWDFTERFPENLKRYETLLTDNRIWKQRCVDISAISKQQAIDMGMTGPLLRATGVEWDLRKTQPYAVYDKLSFDIPVGSTGDCYDRYLVRVEELKQSNSLIRQCIEWLNKNPGPIKIDNPKISPPKRATMKKDMEALIHHFKLYTEGFTIPAGETYAAVEHPKGEFGVYMISDGANKPYRLKIRASGFAHLSCMNHLCKGHLLGDAVGILASLDVVFGEIDR
jgi:NADH-quinone oxidoreductase subunit D